MEQFKEKKCITDFQRELGNKKKRWWNSGRQKRRIGLRTEKPEEKEKGRKQEEKER